MKMKTMKIFSAAALAAVFLSGCNPIAEAAFDANSTMDENGIITTEAAYGIIRTDPKYQECYDIPDPVPPLCVDQLAGDVILAQDLLDYMYARTGEQPYLFAMFEETSQIIPPPQPVDENVTMAPPPYVPILTDLDRKVSCIYFEGDNRAVNMDKFKCLVRKFTDG